MTTASIIIPHWNGKYHLDVCLNSLRQQTVQDFEVIVVDNGSEDGSQAYIKAKFPEVKLIENGENLGFTGACIKGYEAAVGDFIILLNNDTEATPNWLEKLLAGFENQPEIGSVIGKILLFDARDTFHTAGDIVRIDGSPGNRGVWQTDEGQYDEPEFIMSGCGAAVAYRKEALQDAGFLDNSFYFSCEDVDLGWRLNLAGWRVLYQPDAVLYHKLKASSSSLASYYDKRNQLYLIWKNYPPGLLRQHWRIILQQQLKLTREALIHWRGEAARASLRGQLAGLFGFFKMLPARRKIMSGRRLSDESLMELLTPVDEAVRDG
ncbi:MAG: glycosyltransferase family 2 protein [Chloroflexota bacterium]